MNESSEILQNTEPVVLLKAIIQSNYDIHSKGKIKLLNLKHELRKINSIFKFLDDNKHVIKCKYNGSHTYHFFAKNENYIDIKLFDDRITLQINIDCLPNEYGFSIDVSEIIYEIREHKLKTLLEDGNE